MPRTLQRLFCFFETYHLDVFFPHGLHGVESKMTQHC
jgi:hypothetical protein